jgi:radical SAM/Cys-rich protein
MIHPNQVSNATLAQREHPLAEPARQREWLRQTAQRSQIEEFEVRLGVDPAFGLLSNRIQVLQLNLGKLCNQTCKHCHVDAGPDRSEVMTRETMESALAAVASLGIQTVDLTGGAPELNPHFRWLVDRLVERGTHVIDRCNLTILRTGPYRDLPRFLADRRVEIVASLPFYEARATNAQRGERVFEESLDALRELNGLGYGHAGSELILNLVFNPTGAFLAPRQESIEPEFRRALLDRHGVVFHELLVLNNMPIARFLEFLQRTGQTEAYLTKLAAAFNPATIPGLMCRHLLSVGWDGRLHDCDFNQMLEIGLSAGQPRTIADLTACSGVRRIVTGPHCYGCTAGAGSSCSGALVK